MDCPIKECHFKYHNDDQLIEHFTHFHKNVCRYFTSSQNNLLFPGTTGMFLVKTIKYQLVFQHLRSVNKNVFNCVQPFAQDLAGSLEFTKL